MLQLYCAELIVTPLFQHDMHGDVNHLQSLTTSNQRTGTADVVLATTTCNPIAYST
jgi:hypothetical protein